MAASLLKIVVDATTTTVTNIDPVVTKYFYTVNPNDINAGVLTIANTSFVDDNGDPVTSDLVVAAANNGYYLLFINGALQESGLYTVATTSVTINDATDILEDSIVSLVVTNFDPDSTSTTTVET